MPGIHDGHCHPLGGGLALTEPTPRLPQLDLRTRRGDPQALAPPTKSLTAGCRSDCGSPPGMDRQPTKEGLDRLPTRRPIIVADLSGDTAVANWRAGDRRRSRRIHSQPPAGGRIERGPEPGPTGYCGTTRSGSYSDQDPAAPPPKQNTDALQGPDDEERWPRRVTSYLRRVGGRRRELAALAAVADAARWKHPARRGEPSTFPSPGRGGPRACWPGLGAAMRPTPEPEGGRSATVKMFFDGVIEYPTQTAALLQPYRVNKGTKRNPRWVAGKSRGPTYSPPARGQPRDRRPSTRPAGRCTCTPSATGPSAPPSMPSSTRAIPRTRPPTTATRSPTWS